MLPRPAASVRKTTPGLNWISDVMTPTPSLRTDRGTLPRLPQDRTVGEQTPAASVAGVPSLLGLGPEVAPGIA